MTQTLTVPRFLIAMLIAVAAMPTNVYQICAWNIGTLEVEPWRTRSLAACRTVAQRLRSWFFSLWTPRRLAFACGVVLLAALASTLSAHAESATLLAVVPGIPALQERRATLIREADALKPNGQFANDEARTAFDAKMTEVEGIDAQIAQARAANPTPPAPAPAPAPPATPTAEEIRSAAIAGERKRCVDIRSAVKIAKLEPAVGEDMVRRGISIEEARSEIFTKLAAAGDALVTEGQIRMGEGEDDKFARGAGNWLLIKAGMAEDVARAEKAKNPQAPAIDAGEFRGMTMLELAKECLRRAGHKIQGDKMRIVADAFTLRSGGATQSTSDFTVILENTMHKMLLAAFGITPDTWSRFCAKGSVSDFRAHNRYRMGSFSSLDAVLENGEFKRKAITDGAKESITAGTKGNIVNVSRQMIINDDMGAFASLLQMLGRAAKRTVEVDVYALLALNSGLGPAMNDGNTLFHASHGNIGTGAALSAAAIDADRVVLASQTDKDANDYLDLRPAILLLPIGLGGAARVINQSQYDPDTLANKAQMKPNAVVGLFRDVVDTPRLTGTRRYLFAEPSIAPVIEVAFLDGQSEPVLETKDGWDVDGSEMKVRYDYAVGGVGYTGAVTNAGT